MFKSICVGVSFVIACVLIMTEVKIAKSDEDEAEDEMLERAITEPALKVMLNVAGKEDPDIPQGAGPKPILKECPADDSACRDLAIDVHNKILTCENINCKYRYGYEQLQLIRYCFGDDLGSTRVADLHLSEIDGKAPAFVKAREIYQYKFALEKNKEKRAQAMA